MPVSQNGYSANDRSLIASYTVPGSSRKLALRRGDCAVVLLDFAAWFHKNVEPLDAGQLDDWGYAERTIRGSTTTLSNHASGTAMDLNATRHPLGRVGTFTAAQASAIRRKLREYGGVIRWGGDYRQRKDEMHFEINAGAAAVKAQVDRIRGTKVVRPKPIVKKANPYTKPVLTTERPSLSAGTRKTTAETRYVQWAVGAKVDGSWGARTTAAVKVFQERRGLKKDGKVGPKTLAALATVKR